MYRFAIYMCVVALVATAPLSGCFAPSYSPCGIACQQGTECPDNTQCTGGYCLAAGATAEQCANPGGGDAQVVDGSIPAIDVVVDRDAARPDDDMLSVPAGSFQMGCAGPPQDLGCYDDEPLHTVTVSAYEIDRTEITQGNYERCVGAGFCQRPSAGLYDPVGRPLWPALGLDRQMAQDYCVWVGKQLPTEAQWERAARGAADIRVYPWGNTEPTCGSHGQFAPVGCLQSSPAEVDSFASGESDIGAADMAGNVWEWVGDWYGADYYTTGPSDDPEGPSSGAEGVVRGGGYLTGEARFLRVSNRYNRPVGLKAETFGARCARSL